VLLPLPLAALLKLEGYDVAIGFYPSMGIKLGESMFFVGYHHYVLVRDEGWGIGEWHPKEDMFGNPMPGDWIVLDAICSPRHVSHMKMVGGSHKALSFGEDPVWAGSIPVSFVNLNCFAQGQTPFVWGLI